MQLDNTDDQQELLAYLDGKKMRIGVVQARFNTDITHSMTEACLAELMRLGVKSKRVTLVQVPGALEVPLALQTLALRDKFDALIALGCVIRGDTYHFELVCNESASGISRVSLDCDLPIANAVLTVENIKQAHIRAEPKAIEAARVAIEMAMLVQACQS